MSVERKIELVRGECESLLDAWGLGDWSFVIGNAKRQAGSCHYRQKLIRMSWPILELNPISEGIDTVRHEVAHAIAGAGAGHGARWKAMAIETGAAARACGQFKTPPKRWQLICGQCGQRLQKYHNRRQITVHWYHRGCDGSEGTLYLIDLESTTVEIATSQQMVQQELFA